MARESIELQKKRLNSDAAMEQKNAEAIAAEQNALDRLHDFASQTPAEKQAETTQASAEAVAAHEAKQAPGPAANKSLTPVTENKAADHVHDPLEGVPLTKAARRDATIAGLTTADFKRRRKSGNDGEYTVDDVARIVEAKAKD